MREITNKKNSDSLLRNQNTGFLGFNKGAPNDIVEHHTTRGNPTHRPTKLLQRIGASLMATVMLFTSNIFAKDSGSTGTKAEATYTGHPEESHALSGGLQFYNLDNTYANDLTADGMYMGQDDNFYYIMFTNRPTPPGTESSFYRTVGFTVSTEANRDNGSLNSTRIMIDKAYDGTDYDDNSAPHLSNSFDGALDYGLPLGATADITNSNPSVKYQGAGASGESEVTTTCFRVNKNVLRSQVVMKVLGSKYDATKEYTLYLNAINLVQSNGVNLGTSGKAGSNRYTENLGHNWTYTQCDAAFTAAGFSSRSHDSLDSYYKIPVVCPPTNLNAVTILDIENNYKHIGTEAREAGKKFSMKSLLTDVAQSGGTSLRGKLSTTKDSLDELQVVGIAVTPYGAIGAEKYYYDNSAFATWAIGKGAWFSNTDDLHKKIKEKTAEFAKKWGTNASDRMQMNTVAGWFDATGLSSTYFGPNNVSDQFVSTPEGLSLAENMSWDIQDDNGGQYSRNNPSSDPTFWAGTQVYLFVKHGSLIDNPGNGNIVFYNNATGAPLATAEVNWAFIDQEVKNLYTRGYSSDNYYGYGDVNKNVVLGGTTSGENSKLIKSVNNYNLDTGAISKLEDLKATNRILVQALYSSIDNNANRWAPSNKDYKLGENQYGQPSIITTQFPSEVKTKSGQILKYKGVEVAYSTTVSDDIVKTAGMKGNTIPNLNTYQSIRKTAMETPIESNKNGSVKGYDDKNTGKTEINQIYPYNYSGDNTYYVVNPYNERTTTEGGYIRDKWRSFSYKWILDKFNNLTSKGIEVSDDRTFAFPTVISEVYLEDSTYKQALTYANRFTIAHMPWNLKIYPNLNENLIGLTSASFSSENLSGFTWGWAPTKAGTNDNINFDAQSPVNGYTCNAKELGMNAESLLNYYQTLYNNPNLTLEDLYKDEDGNVLDHSGMGGMYATSFDFKKDNANSKLVNTDYTKPTGNYIVRVIYEPAEIPVIYYYDDPNPDTGVTTVKVASIATIARKEHNSVKATMKVNGKTWFTDSTNYRENTSKEKDIEETLKDNTIFRSGESNSNSLDVVVPQSLVSSNTPYVIRVKLIPSPALTSSSTPYEMGSFQIQPGYLGTKFTYHSMDGTNWNNLTPLNKKNIDNVINKTGILDPTKLDALKAGGTAPKYSSEYNNTAMVNAPISAIIDHSTLTQMFRPHKDGDMSAEANIDGNPLTGKSVNYKTTEHVDSDGNTYETTSQVNCVETISFTNFSDIVAGWSKSVDTVFDGVGSDIMYNTSADTTSKHKTTKGDTMKYPDPRVDASGNELGKFENASVSIDFSTAFSASRASWDFKPTIAKYAIADNSNLKDDLKVDQYYLDDPDHEQNIYIGKEPAVTNNKFTYYEDDAKRISVNCTPDNDNEIVQTVHVSGKHSATGSAVDEAHDPIESEDLSLVPYQVDQGAFGGYIIPGNLIDHKHDKVIPAPSSTSTTTEGTKTTIIVEPGTSLKFYPYYTMTTSENKKVPILTEDPQEAKTNAIVTIEGEESYHGLQLKAIFTRGTSDTLAAGSAYQLLANGVTMEKTITVQYLVANENYIVNAGDYNSDMTTAINVLIDALGKPANYDYGVLTNIPYATGTVERYALKLNSGSPSVDSNTINTPGPHGLVKNTNAVEEHLNKDNTSDWYKEKFPMENAVSMNTLTIKLKYTPGNTNTAVVHLKCTSQNANEGTEAPSTADHSRIRVGDTEVKTNIKFNNGSYLVDRGPSAPYNFSSAIVVTPKEGNIEFFKQPIKFRMYTDSVSFKVQGTAYDYRE